MKVPTLGNAITAKIRTELMPGICLATVSRQAIFFRSEIFVAVRYGRDKEGHVAWVLIPTTGLYLKL